MTNFYQSKKILVTGGLGFIGSSLAHELVSSGAEVTILDSMFPEGGANKANIKGIEEQVTINYADLRDEAAIKELVQNKDIVFNLAGLLSHSDSMKNPVEDLMVNGVAHLMLLENVRQFNPKTKVIYTGTRNEYGLVKYAPIDEEYKLDPSDPNSISKMAGGSYHLLYARLYDLPIVYLRLPNVYGPRHQMKHHRQGVLNWFIRQVIDGQEITIYGDGKQIRDCNYVGDVVEALLMVGEKEQALGQVFNLGGCAVSLIDYVETLIKINGSGSYKKIPFPEDAKKIEIGDYVADTSKIKKMIGWEAKVSLEEGLRKTLDYYHENKKLYW